MVLQISIKEAWPYLAIAPVIVRQHLPLTTHLAYSVTVLRPDSNL